MISQLNLRQFRCFESLAVEFAPGFNFFVGANGQGKTSILEAACVLLRLQSQRSASLAPLVRKEAPFFALAGCADGHAVEFRYRPLRRRLLLDGVEQRGTADYLELARVVSFANSDIDLVRGGSEGRRRYLDFLGSQLEARYRPILRRYERALRSRNALLRQSAPRPRELAAYDGPLVEAGSELLTLRAGLVARLAPLAAAAHGEIAGAPERFALRYLPGSGPDFAGELEQSRGEETRLRQTQVGPHRDDLELLVDEMAAPQFASEGQQRTVALALKIAQARVFEETNRTPLLLLDDIFGELDRARRNRLLTALPDRAQKLVTATAMDWLENLPEGPVWELSGRMLRPAGAGD